MNGGPGCPRGIRSRPSAHQVRWRRHQICVNGGPPKRTLAAARGWLANVDPQTASKHAELYGAVATALAAADDCAGLPTAFVHPDFWPGNVVTNPQGELVPIDWTGAGRGPRIRSFATLLWLAVTRHPRGPRLDMTAAAAAGYREHVRLSPDEIDRLPGAILNPVTALACLQFCSGNPRAAAKLVDPTLRDLADRITEQVRLAMGVDGSRRVTARVPCAQRAEHRCTGLPLSPAIRRLRRSH